MKLKLILINLFAISCLNAQEEPLFGLFWNNYSYFNPGSTGVLHDQSAFVTFRNQWQNTNGAPATLQANYNLKVDKLHGGVGLNYLYESIGFSVLNKFLANYSYHFDINETGKFGVGISAGLANLKWGNDNSTVFTGNIGLFYKTEHLELGLSSTQITESRYDIGFRHARNYWLNAAYLFNIGKNFALKPEVLLRSDLVKMVVNYNILAIYKEQLSLGFTYRNTTTFALMASYDLFNKFRIGYCYEFSKGINSFTGNSHEIVLGFYL